MTKWNGWDCTRCGRYHGYGEIFTHGEEVLCVVCHGYEFCEDCNINRRPKIDQASRTIGCSQSVPLRQFKFPSLFPGDVDADQS